jgi:dextranase
MQLNLISFRAPLAALLLAVVSPMASSQVVSTLSSDKARYNPGDAVRFDLGLSSAQPGRQVRISYRHQTDLIAQETFTLNSASTSWSWQPPSDDYRGYLVELEVLDVGATVDRSTLAVDVSSDWARFPRYGFLSSFDYRTDGQMDEVIASLNRYHINGIQFYDWANKHHDPLAGTAGAADGTWKNIANQTNDMGTVRGYIDRAHSHNMMAMSYNLANGALAGATADGVSEEWYLYKDAAGTTRDSHDLPDDWQSDIDLTDPANPGWQNYLGAHTADAYREFAFDGSHVDTLGHRGTVYAKAGYEVDLAWSYGQFASALKRNVGGSVVMNAVGQYGQEHIAQADVDFLYTEVWDDHRTYNDLAGIIQANSALSGGRLNTVLAAYVNYDRNKSPGEFNAPSVLMTNAVTFAFGGAHIELGEHMLANEYFPYSNLSMSPSLRKQMVGYYDFLVGYQNLLRDGGRFDDNPLAAANADLTMWPARAGSIAAVNKTVGRKELFHLINFRDAVHMDWRDSLGWQPEPAQVDDLQLSFFSYKPLGRLWAASPDVAGGVPVELTYTRSPDGTVRFNLPTLKYWSMVVAEEMPFTGRDDAAEAAYAGTWADGSNGGSGFGAWRLVSSASQGGYAGFWRTGDAEAGQIQNAGVVERAGGAAWGSFANGGGGIEKAAAFRAFDRPLQSRGDLFSVTLEHGHVEGQVGLALRSGNAGATADDFATDARMLFYFEGGDSHYTLSDGSGILDTGIGWTDFGVKLEMHLTGRDTYDLLVWRFDEANDLAPQVFTFAGRSLMGLGVIDSLALFQFDAAGGGMQGDVFFNHLYYTAAAVPEPAGGVLALLCGMMLVRRTRCR